MIHIPFSRPQPDNNKDIFKEVRNYECFKYLHLGIISPIKRKSLPEIAKVVSINSAQSLHHFIANSEWSVNFVVIMESGWQPLKALERISGVNFPGHLTTKNQKLDISEK